jgi:predicted dehydrogenase
MRLALIGCGLIGAKRAAAAAAAGHQIVVTCDPHRTRREALARQTGAHPVADWREALALDIEAVMIATFHDQLAEIALAAVAQNRHVLVEKPGARTADELHPIEEALRRSQCVMKVGFNHRFHPAVMRAKRLLDEDAIGRPMFVRARYGHGGRLGYEQEWRFDPKRSGGGELIDQGSHLIDLARWFLGDLGLAFGAAPRYFWPGEVDDNCFLALTNHDGAMAWLQASWTEWKNVFSFEVMGRDGKLTIEGLGGSYGVERLTHHRMLPQMGPPETTIWEFPFPDRSFADEFENFIAAIEGREEPLGDIRDAIANLEIIRAVYRGSS